MSARPKSKQLAVLRQNAANPIELAQSLHPLLRIVDG